MNITKIKYIDLIFYFFIRIKNSKNCEDWKIIIEKVMDICLMITEIVNPIVKSDSPEGIFPSELSSNLKNLLN